MEGAKTSSEKNSFDNQCEILIGVLAVQGSFYEHINAITRLKDDVYTNSLSDANGLKVKNVQIKIVDIRSPKDVSANMRGLIIPGGESTTLNIFLKDNGFFEAIEKWMRCEGNVVWGTCAGMILLSNSVVSQKVGGQLKFGGVDVTTCRNYFGRQRQSFESSIELHDEQLSKCLRSGINEDEEHFHGIFIRAPGIVSINNKEDVKVLATLPPTPNDMEHGLRNGTNNLRDASDTNDIVAVRQGNMMITSFHPELTDDLRFHKYFVDMVIAGFDK